MAKSPYKSTLNLPVTTLPIKVNPHSVEEAAQAQWAGLDGGKWLYQKLLERPEATKTYILHDGPPYPNGDIHLGHALNKVLKDIIVKYKSMQGFLAPYVPGWDCHGLPIETQLIKQIGDKRKEMSIVEFRQKCKEYALNYVDLQRTEFKRLGILGEWGRPYLTIDHAYEEKIVELFGALAEKGYIYRGLKPIHWCPHCETALAEAEIEYKDEKSPSIFIKFKVINPKTASVNKKSPVASLGLPVSFVVWTTTPWTLPDNVAIAAHPDFEYVFLKVNDEIYVVAEGLVEDFVKRVGIEEHKIIDKTKGKYLEGILCRHPFIDREVPVVLDNMVTLEQGTGFVHIAPGHGAEDYKVGLKYKLPIVMPVDDRGYFDESVPDFIKGQHYDASNKLITEKIGD